MTAEDRAAHVEREAVAGVNVDLIAALWRDHAGCNWVSTGVNVRWTCGIIHPGPIHMQPTTRDRHLAALVMTQIEADRSMAALPQTGDATAVLADLDARCRRAEKTLHTLGPERPATREAARLDGKRQGVALVRSYIKEAHRALTAGADQ